MSDKPQPALPVAYMRGTLIATSALAISSTLATLFLAYQAWMARTTYMDATQSRFLEKKLELCFDNFDAAVDLDAALRLADQTIPTQDWPPRVTATSPEALAVLKTYAVPKLDALEGSLTKAEALGGLDKYRGFIVQEVRGLSKKVLELPPETDSSAPMNEGQAETFRSLSDLLSAQYAVFTGCRLLAEGSG